MARRRPTGYLFHEKYMWHNPGELVFDKWLQPCRHWEHADTKRRMHNLISASGLLDSLQMVRPRQATEAELCYFHTPDYVTRVKDLSTRDGGDVGLEVTIGPGGYEIAALAAGGAIAATDAVLSEGCANAYALVRPPGHHATKSSGMGFCVFNNIVIAAEHALRKWGDKVKRIAILDFDVHHGNGTQEAFASDDRVLFISVHQDNNFPANSGAVDESGFDKGEGFTINVPLPAGSGSAAYSKVMSDIVVPAFDAFKPHLILASCGFDASYLDPLGRMTLGSRDFAGMTEKVLAQADKHCQGRVVMFHEGGYSEVYVPFCGLAVLEALSGECTGVLDPLQEEQRSHDGGHFPDHQKAVIEGATSIVKILERRCDAFE